LTGAVQGGFTVPVSSADLTATSSGPNADYQAIAGGTTLSFSGTAGETRTVSVSILGDTIVEADETFNVLLGVPSNAAVSRSDGTGIGTITNNDTATFAINDVSVAEGNSGTTQATFTVTLTGQVQGGFTLPYSSLDGTAIAPADYTAIAGNPQLSFAGTNGEIESITVLVNGDTQVEADETFQVLLGAASMAGVSASDGTGVGTITNDDAATISINDVTVVEGNSGTVNAVFTVTLSGDVQGGFSVSATSANVTAIAPGDYTAVATPLNFAGTSGETKTVTVLVNGDTDVESDEFFVVNLGVPSSASVTVSDGTGVGTIQNDDGL
jgi:ribosomal protein L35AE/L33A